MKEEKTVDILLVEDRAEDAELAMMAFKEKNLANSIVWVKDGEEALKYLFEDHDFLSPEQDRPKVVLLDVKMPKVDGIEVLRRIRSEESTKTMPVIMLTTSKEDQDKIEAYQLGVNSYITKPVLFDEFLSAVSEIGYYWLLLNEPPVK